jgi:putative membrane protein
MRAWVFAKRAELVPPPRAPTAEAAAGGSAASDPARLRLLHRMTWGDVLLFGVISNKGMVLVAAALGALWQFDLWDRLEGVLEPRHLERLEQLKAPSLVVGLALGAAALLAFLLLMRVLSIVWAFLRFHDFRLHGRGDDLRAEHGLLTRISKTIPRHRIQVLSAREGPLHRIFARVSVLARTAGGGSAEEGGGRGRLWLAPLIAKGDLPALLRDVLPALELTDPPWQPIAVRAWRRLFRRALVPLGLAVGAGGWWLGPWALAAALPLGGWAYLHARLYVRHAGYALVPGAVLYRSGWWVRRWSVVRFSKIQSVARRESPFDRRSAMASLAVDTAGGSWGQGVNIEFLDAPVATALLGRLSDEAGRTSFRW